MTARARLTDPETSHEAAASLRDLRDSQVQVYQIIATAPSPVSDEDLSYMAQMQGYRFSASGLRTRRSELVRLGWVRDSGQRSVTRSGRRTILWESS